MADEYVTSHRAITELIGDRQGARRLLVSGNSRSARDLSDAARRAGVPVERVSPDRLAAIAPGARDFALEIATSTGKATSLREFLDGSPAEGSIVLVLDHVLDPHNLGAILRSADQFGVAGVVVPERRSAPLTATVIQSSAGTATHVPLFEEKNLARAIEMLQKGEFWVYSAEMAGTPIHETNLSGSVAIVMGGEGKGVSRLVSERSDGQISIPMNGHADSLNVSVASGIVLYEVRRQQGWLTRVGSRR